MSTKAFAAAGVLVLAGACGSGGKKADSAGGASEADRWRIEDPVTVTGLTIFPVTATGRTEAPEVATLDEALGTAKAVVREVGEGDGEVNFLEVENLGDRPILLLGGEIVQGGNQDRMIGQDVAIGPGELRTIPVFCVEPGRWTPQAATGAGPSTPSSGFATAEAVAHLALRQVGCAVRDQGKVWEEVRKANAAVGAEGSSDTYLGFLESEENRSKSREAERRAEAALAGPGVVGFVAFLGEKPIAADVFASPELFARFRAKLLRSYAAQAAVDGEASGSVPTREAAAKFLADARAGAKKTEETSGLRRLVRREGERAFALECLAGEGGTLEHLNVVAK